MSVTPDQASQATLDADPVGRIALRLIAAVRRIQTNHLAFDFVNVKLKSRPDAVDLDPKADSPDHEELAKSSPDYRLDQALKELRDAVADEVLENLDDMLRFIMRFESSALTS